MVARYLGVFPVLALIAAVGIRYTMALIVPRAGRAATLSMALLVIGLSIVQINYYFNVHLPGFELEFRQARPGRDLDDVVLRASRLPMNTRVHIITDWPDVDTYYKGQIAWMSGYFGLDHDAIDIIGQQEFTMDYVRRLARSTNQAFFVVPGDRETLAKLETRFELKSGMTSPYADIPLSEQYILYFVPTS
jgi:hypothetical protein